MIYSFRDVVELVAEVVEEAGDDFIYAPCPIMSYSYSHAVVDEYGCHSGAHVPGCIVGRVMAKLGWRPNGRDRGDFKSAYLDMIEDLDVALTPRAVFYLDVLQKTQDAGATWAVARDAASRIAVGWLDGYPDKI